MKKVLKIIGIIFLIFIVLGIVGSTISPNSKKLDVKKSIEEGYNKGKEILKPTYSPEFENEVYEYSKQLNKKYTDALFVNDNIPTREQLDEAEKRAIKETAQKFKITEDEVKSIFLKVDSVKNK